jgi:photosystem II stability/assembly factor-like uncharacterized protein
LKPPPPRFGPTGPDSSTRYRAVGGNLPGDGGTAWRLIGQLPSGVHTTQTYNVTMAFTSPTRGWVQTTDPAATIFTADAEEGAEGSPSSLLATSDSGRAWRTLDDPCQGIVPTGLLALAPSRLVLYCQLGGGGGNQGRVRLYTTASAGQVWTLTSEGSIQGRRRGNIGDFQSFDLALAGDHRRLWLLGFVGGVQTSTDGGFHWTNTSIPTGGYDSRLVTAAATSAWLPLPGVALYRTRNGHSWTRLP